MKREAKPESEEDFDFFTTVGDNLYPHQADAPTQEEFFFYKGKEKRDKFCGCWRLCKFS